MTVNLDAIFDLPLPGRLKLILIDLARLSDVDGFVRVKTRDIAHHTQCNPDNVAHGLVTMCDRGYLKADPFNRNGVVRSWRVDERFRSRGGVLG
jgi:hypothetical protein